MENQPKRESDIQNAVVTYARSLRIIARKLNFGEGWPDYLFLFGGQVLFVEFKKKGEAPTALQTEMHNILRAEGFHVQVINDETLGKITIRMFYHAALDRLAKVRPLDYRIE